MEPSFQTKRQADSYTRTMPPGTDQQSTCISLPFTDRNACYILSSDHQEQQQGQTATAGLLGSPLHPLMIRMPSHDSTSGFYDPMIPYDQCQPKTEDFWPTPPSEPEDFGHVHYQQQQSPPADHQPTPYARNILMSSASSPSSQNWTPAPIQTTGFHSADALHIQQPTIDLRTFTPISATASDVKLPFSQAESKAPFACNFGAGFDTPAVAMGDQYPSPELSYGSSMPPTTIVSSRPTTNRGAKKTPLMESSAQPMAVSVKRPASSQSTSRDAAEPAPTASSSLRSSPKTSATPLAPARGGSGGGSGKGSEPYAKLIERALLSRPDYKMTLQEIYQWFEENTDKSKTEGKGWQNSIRHNLSMNAAFSKNEPKLDEDVMTARDPKRSTEWVLADWAVKDGVQSTTRYRKTNTSRKAMAARIWGEPYTLEFRPAVAAPGGRPSLMHGFEHGRLRGQGFAHGHMGQGLLPLATTGMDSSGSSAMEHVFSSPASMYGHGQFSVSAAIDSTFNSSRESTGMLVPMPTPSTQDHNGFFDGGWVDAPGPFDHQAVAGDNGSLGYDLHPEYIDGLPYEES